jgi:hypothetical protein
MEAFLPLSFNLEISKSELKDKDNKKTANREYS